MYVTTQGIRIFCQYIPHFIVSINNIQPLNIYNKPLYIVNDNNNFIYMPLCGAMKYSFIVLVSVRHMVYFPCFVSTVQNRTCSVAYTCK